MNNLKQRTKRLYRRSDRAITLIALVITIIVLLILAGVTINMVMGENGLINKAQNTVGKYENAQEQENIELTKVAKDIQVYIDGNRNGSINDADLIEWLKAGNVTLNTEDVINNKTLEKLMNSKGSVDYMFAHSNIINSVMQSKYAIEVLSKSEYASYKLYLNTSLWNAFKESEYFSIFHQNRLITPILTSKLSSDVGTIESNGDATLPYWCAFSANVGWIPAGEGGSPQNRYVGIKFNNSEYVIYGYSFTTYMNAPYSVNATANIIGYQNEIWKNIKENIPINYNNSVQSFSNIFDSNERVKGVGFKLTSGQTIRTHWYCGYTYNLKIYGFKLNSVD